MSQTTDYLHLKAFNCLSKMFPSELTLLSSNFYTIKNSNTRHEKPSFKYSFVQEISKIFLAIAFVFGCLLGVVGKSLLLKIPCNLETGYSCIRGFGCQPQYPFRVHNWTSMADEGLRVKN